MRTVLLGLAFGLQLAAGTASVPRRPLTHFVTPPSPPRPLELDDDAVILLDGEPVSPEAFNRSEAEITVLEKLGNRVLRLEGRRPVPKALYKGGKYPPVTPRRP